MLHLIQGIKVQKQFIAELATAAVVVLRIYNQRLDAALVHLGKHVVEKLGERIVLRIHALVELQITDAMLWE